MACKACKKSHTERSCMDKSIPLSKRMYAGVEYESDRSSSGGYGDAVATDFVVEVRKMEKRIAELERAQGGQLGAR